MHRRRPAGHRPRQGHAGVEVRARRSASSCRTRSSSRRSPATGPTAAGDDGLHRARHDPDARLLAPPRPRPGRPTGRCRSSTTSTTSKGAPDRRWRRATCSSAWSTSTAQQGWHPIVAPEMEFYLVARNTRPGQADRADDGPHGPSGRGAAGLFDVSAVDEYGPVIDDIYDFAEAQGFEIDGITAGGRRGPGRDQPAPRRPGEAGRRDLLLQAPDPRGGAAPRLLRHLHGQADRGRAGQRHAHPPLGGRHEDRARTSSPARRAARRTPSSTSSAACRRTCPQVIAVLAPYVNSYRRYVKDFAAPINLDWGRDNRTTGLRVPISEPESRRVENRLRGHGLQPLPRHRRLARLRLSRPDEGDLAVRSPSRATPTTAARNEHAARDGRRARHCFAEAQAEIREILGDEFCRVYEIGQADWNTTSSCRSSAPGNASTCC